MSHETTILEELLARVQRNAALPRTLVSATEHAVVAAPQPTVAPYVAPPQAFSAEPAYVAAPAPVYQPEPPAFQPEFEPYVPPAPAAEAASLDASVDDLLLEDPFPSVPAPAAPSYSDVLEEEPIPLVSVSSQRSHDDDISGVMVVSELNEDQPEELLEDDIVEMASGDSEAPAANPLDELNFDDEELDADHASAVEEPPASSSRSKIAGTMDEALARAAEQITLDEGREVPLKTPPPESGPQAAMGLPAGIQAPLAPDIEALLEADIHAPGGVHSALPTPEQLGQTIDLDEARGPSLELDHPSVAMQPELPREELEATLPPREYGGGYADDLLPPPEAQQDLDAHRQRAGDGSVLPGPAPSAQPELAAASGDFAAVGAPSNVTTDSTSAGVSMVTVGAPANAEFAPEFLARPAVGPTPVAKFIRAQPPRPNTFLELLDASLSLGND